MRESTLPSHPPKMEGIYTRGLILLAPPKEHVALIFQAHDVSEGFTLALLKAILERKVKVIIKILECTNRMRSYPQDRISKCEKEAERQHFGQKVTKAK